MSVEPQALERSVLERKTGNELAAIAEALGMKPRSRIRKDELVDQILQEAGVKTARSSQEGPLTDPSAAGNADPAVGGTATPAAEVPLMVDAAASGGPPSPGVNGGGPEKANEPGVTSEPGETEKAGDASKANAQSDGAGVASDVEAKVAEPTERPAGRPDNGGAERERERDHGPRERSDRPPRERQAGGYGDSGTEAGNRRNRRRRGRDREGQPQSQDRPEQPFSGEPVPVEGLLDLRDEGYGFLRTTGFLASPKDIYVSLSQVRRFGLRKGDYVVGASRPANNNEKYPALLRIDTVSGMSPDEARTRPRFEDLTPLFPDEKLRLEIPGDSANMVSRIVDLISPIGKGQRGLIVSPPKAGKTTVLKQIAHSIEANNPEVHLMVLLVDERPEEVTDMRRSVKGEVIASTFDRPSEEHTQVAELAIDRAKRLVEVGRDVVIVLDGITRLARAYNLAQPATGRIMSGGVDSGALYPPKKFFGSARNIEEGGSLTILATALVETGSRMDVVFFEEFKGTGNMELRLDRKLAERRVYPALDVNASSTRHEELLFERKELELVWRLRRVLNGLSEGGSAAAGLELLMEKIKTTKSNSEFLAEIAKAPVPPVT